MMICIEDKQHQNKCLKETDSVFCDDVVQDVVECLMGLGYQKESIFKAFEIMLQEYGKS